MNDTPRPRKYDGETFLYGVCYFPEQWPESMWDDDFRRMADLGMNVVRMGEGAWHLWEPEEGYYEFDLFDRAIELAARHGLKVILGTPTYTPPAWLTETYPEVLRADFRRTLMRHGSRRHYNYTSLKYLALCRGVVLALARHYGEDERVIGWQIDNELNCHMDVSFAESDEAAFNAWCQQRYGTLDRLNDAWGTAFWAQHYTDWSQVHLPRPTVTYQNPGQLLDFYRFTSDATVAYAAQQYDILQRLAPRQFVTHNGYFQNVDNCALTERGMDFMSFDSYPAFQYRRPELPEHFRDRNAGFQLSTVRGLSDKFLILEQQAGPGGQGGGAAFVGAEDYLHASPRPGQMRLWAWQSIAHGADGLLFFRWRTALFGSETLWHGLNHYGNQPSRRYAEARQLGEELTRVGQRLLESQPVADAAILYDYDNTSNLQAEQYLTPAYRELDEAIYRTLSTRGVLADRLDLQAVQGAGRLERYRVVYYPNAQLLESADLEPLRRYVEAGGILVFGPRGGYKDRQSRAHPLPFPGVLRDLIGLELDDFTMLEYGPSAAVRFGEGESIPARHFTEILRPDGKAEVLASYSEGDDAGAPAVARFPLGKGSVVYCGTFLPDHGLDALHGALGLAAMVPGLSQVPRDVEVVRRRSQGSELLLLLNFSDQPQTVTLERAGTELLSGTAVKQELQLPAFGVSMLDLSLRRHQDMRPVTLTHPG